MEICVEIFFKRILKVFVSLVRLYHIALSISNTQNVFNDIKVTK